MQNTISRTGISNSLIDPLGESQRIGPPALKLISCLGRELTSEGINYCHWKSNSALDRSILGENDLDLLVSREDALRFTEILCRLGFKLATAPPEKHMPGVLDYYGYDEETGKLVHVHAHYQLVLGHDMTKNYRLPIEEPYLESAVQGDLLKVPAPEFEFVVFVIRMVLKHATWDVILGRQGKLKTTERQEMVSLQDQIDHHRVLQILKKHLPKISVGLFEDCVRAIQPDCPTWVRVQTGQKLQAKLQANTRYPLLIDVYLKIWRRSKIALRRRITKSDSKCHLETGGAMIAIVGGDGAGKSTAVDALCQWLSKDLEVTSVHMGKPPWSLTTITIRGALKIGQLLRLYPPVSPDKETIEQKSPVSPGYPWLLREVCRARDRYWVYRKAGRFAANGGLVICDRYPIPQIRLMDGPLTRQFVSLLTSGPRAKQFLSPHPDSRLTRSLVAIEENYYLQIAWPDLLIVLLVDPEIAVQRKTTEEPASVRERSREIWEQNWKHCKAQIIDASRPKNEVLKELRALIWSAL